MTAMRRGGEAVAIDAGDDGRNREEGCSRCDAIRDATDSWVVCAMRQAVALVLPRHRGCERNRVEATGWDEAQADKAR